MSADSTSPQSDPSSGRAPERAPLTPDQKRFRGLIRGAAKLRKEGESDDPGAPREGGTPAGSIDQRTEQLLGLFEERGFGEEQTGISAAFIANSLRDATSLEDSMAVLQTAAQRTDTRLADTPDTLSARIDELLRDPALRAHATTLLRQELARYRRARPTVKRVAKLTASVDVAAKLRAAIAAQAMREKGSLIGSDAEAVGTLTTTERALEQRREETITNADDPTLGFLNADTLLGYRRQLQTKGFAETPSRRALQEKLRTALSAGKRVLLAGATGTGKTQLAVYEVELHSGRAEVASGHEAMTTGELYGKKILATDEDGRVQTKFSQGPRTRALERAGFVFDEVDTVNNRTLMRMKHELNLKAGQETAVQENGEETLVINANFSEVWTANLLSAKHPERVDMDAAILRLFDSLEVGFMPAGEVRDLMLTNIMDPSGAIPLSASEIRLLTRFAEAAEQTQRAYNGEPTVLRAAKGEGKDQLGKVFLDPGRVFTMMKEWPVARATGTTLGTYLKSKLEDFLAKPEFKAAPEDRALLREFFDTYQLLDGASAKQANERPFTLPSELGFLTRAPQPQTDDTGLDGDSDAPADATRTTAPERRERPEGQLGIAELQRYLGFAVLENRLLRPLEAFVETYEQAYADGPLGFQMDRNALFFPNDRDSLSQLVIGLQAHSLNGITITAYPTAAQIKAMAPKWAQYRVGKQPDMLLTVEGAEAELLAMPITTFLALHFEARGGTLYDREDRIKEWATARWEPNTGMSEAGYTTLPIVYSKATDHESAYNLLKDQPTLADVQGRTLLSFADVTQDPQTDTVLFQNAIPGSSTRISAQGDGLTFERLMAAHARITDPTDALALLAAADPNDTERYPDQETWSHYAAITPSFALSAYSGSAGACLGWFGPGGSGACGRARSVLRGTPGWAGLVPTARSAVGDLAGGPKAVRDAIDASTNLTFLEREPDTISLFSELTSSAAALSKGPLGFAPDLSKISFPTDRATLGQLRKGIESGALTGALLTAYPSEADLPRLVTALNAQEVQRVEEAKADGGTYVARAHTLESLKSMPVTEFLARHFEARGGKFRDRDARIKEWSSARWVPNPLEAPTGSTTLQEVYVAASTHKDAYDDLSPQATLGDVLGTSALSFAHTRKEISTEAPILQPGVDDDAALLKQGAGLKFKSLMAQGGTPPNPVEWLSLLGRCDDPTDVTTYPTPYGFTGVDDSWEWIGAITPSSALYACSGSAGAFLGGYGPGGSGACGRARSVLRGTPG